MQNWLENLPYSVGVLHVDIHADAVRAVVRPDFLLQLRILNPLDLDSKKPLDDSLAEVGVFHHAAEHKVVCEAKLLDRLYAVDIVFVFVHIILYSE